jgi:hypothetical protein
MADREVDEIKAECFERLGERWSIAIVKSDYGWRVEQWTGDSIFPSSDYDTPQEAAARALQLLGISEPVTPQTWPEIAEIRFGA